ncbi:protein NOI4-like [Arachis stenosperma]|uniref:protein NOI4-like n=1 Tax=Arachis stenosperma TaxID=217475 RepID=UPI0025AC5E89|nr:protein NOI4-like [Arachis stenosperma]
MADSEEGGRALPKFGEWDVNDPASADGFTVIFNKARNEKKAASAPKSLSSPKPPHHVVLGKPHPNRKWLCCINSSE